MLKRTTTLLETAAVTDDGRAKCSKKTNLTGENFPHINFLINTNGHNNTKVSLEQGF